MPYSREKMISTLDPKFLEKLRIEAIKGATVSELVQLIQNSLNLNKDAPSQVLFYFMGAFNLPFLDIKELPAASCLGGGAYTDEEIDQLIRPHIEEHYLNKQGKASNERENK